MTKSKTVSLREFLEELSPLTSACMNMDCYKSHMDEESIDQIISAVLERIPEKIELEIPVDNVFNQRVGFNDAIDETIKNITGEER